MTDAGFAALGTPSRDNRGQRSGSRSRKRRKRGNVEHIHLVNSLLLARAASLQRLPKTSAALPMGSRFSYLPLLATRAGAFVQKPIAEIVRSRDFSDLPHSQKAEPASVSFSLTGPLIRGLYTLYGLGE